MEEDTRTLDPKALNPRVIKRDVRSLDPKP